MLSLNRLCVSVATTLGVLAATALAQPDPSGQSQPFPSPTTTNDPANPTTEPIPPPVVDPATTYADPPPAVHPEYREQLFDRLGFSLTAGGGVEGFTGDSARAATTDGGNWDVRASIGTRSFLTFEASYIGSAQAIDALGLDNNAVLVSNGVQGNLRLNLLDRTGVQPFLYAGAAWRRYDVTNTDLNTSDISDTDDVLEIPMGVGVAYKYRGFLLDARGEFRAATNEDLMPSLTSIDPGDKASLHRYGVSANLGYEF